MKKIIETQSAPAAVGPYSQAVEAAGTLWVSGQIPIDPATGAMPDGIEAQTEQVFANIRAILQAAGYGMDDVVKCTVLLADMNDFGAVNAIYARNFISEMPARACYAVRELPRKALVEIEAVAVKK